MDNVGIDLNDNNEVQDFIEEASITLRPYRKDNWYDHVQEGFMYIYNTHCNVPGVPADDWRDSHLPESCISTPEPCAPLPEPHIPSPKQCTLSPGLQAPLPEQHAPSLSLHAPCADAWVEGSHELAQGVTTLDHPSPMAGLPAAPTESANRSTSPALTPHSVAPSPL